MIQKYGYSRSRDDKDEIIDLHELCVEGDYAGLKSALESSKRIDGEDDYQSDEEAPDSGAMFDYRSPLFYTISLC